MRAEEPALCLAKWLNFLYITNFQHQRQALNNNIKENTPKERIHMHYSKIAVKG